MSEQELRQLIKEWAGYLVIPPALPNLNKEALLTTIATVESTFGQNNRPKYEAAYAPGGNIYNGSQLLQAKVTQYGRDASCSWSSWQIMFITAAECGFSGKPSDLAQDAVAIKYVVKMLNSRILGKNPTKLEDIFDAYNSGNFRDRVIPLGYIAKSMSIYNTIMEKMITEAQGYLKDHEEGTTDEQPVPIESDPAATPPAEPSTWDRIKAWWNSK